MDQETREQIEADYERSLNRLRLWLLGAAGAFVLLTPYIVLVISVTLTVHKAPSPDLSGLLNPCLQAVGAILLFGFPVASSGWVKALFGRKKPLEIEKKQEASKISEKD